MLSRWLTLALLAGSVITGRALTVAPPCKINIHPDVEVTLNCGGGENAGAVQHWHTPFGDLRTPGFPGNQDPVFLHHDGSLVIPNASVLHSGPYYCLLRGEDGGELWRYELRVRPGDENRRNRDNREPSDSCAAVRFRRSADSADEEPAGVSDGAFAGAVAASVMLTFVAGFSAGAASSARLLRCFGGVAMRRQSRQPDVPDHDAQITMTTMPSVHSNRAFESEGDAAEMTAVTTPPPPAKPQRSFRHKRDEEEEAAAYLEGCDRVEGGAGGVEGGAGGVEAASDGEPKEKEEALSDVHLSEDGGNQTETDEEKHGEEEEEDGGAEEEEAAGDGGSEEDGDDVGSDEDVEKTREEVKEKGKCEETEQKSSEGSESSSATRGRRSRVIRLYQYDEDGQRFGHLPDPAPEDQGPAPKLKQRSLSLTRLSAIMAAASAGPLDQKEAVAMESEERPHFHMEI